MSPPITEIGNMSILPSKTPTDFSTPDGLILKEAWERVVSEPGGPQRVFWGVERRMEGNGEDGNGEKGEGEERRIWTFFDWESLGQHEEFAKNTGIHLTAPFHNLFTPGFTKHISLDTTPLLHPLVQVFLFYFPSTFASDNEKKGKKEGVEERVRAGLERLEKSGEVRVEVSKGWGLETDFPFPVPIGDGDGREKAGSVFMVLIGWEGGWDACRAFTSPSSKEKKKEEEGEGKMLGLGKEEGCLTSRTFYLTCDVMSRA